MTDYIFKYPHGTIWYVAPKETTSKKLSDEPKIPNYMLIISNDTFNAHSHVLTCLPLHAKGSGEMPSAASIVINNVEYKIRHEFPTGVLSDLLREFVGILPTPILTQVKRNVASHFGMDNQVDPKNLLSAYDALTALTSQQSYLTPPPPSTPIQPLPVKTVEEDELYLDPALLRTPPIIKEKARRGRKRKEEVKGKTKKKQSRPRMIYTKEDIAFLTDATTPIAKIMEKYGLERKSQAYHMIHLARKKAGSIFREDQEQIDPAQPTASPENGKPGRERKRGIGKKENKTIRKYSDADIAFLKDSSYSVEAIMERFGLTKKQQAYALRTYARTKR